MPDESATGPSDIVRFGGGFILVVLSLIGLIAIGMTIRDVSHYFAVKTWVETPGVVTRVSIRERTSETGPYRHRPRIEYSYTVDSHPYESDNAMHADEMSRAEAEAVVLEHPKGAPLTVFYDPSAPRHSTLDPTPPLMTATTFGFLLPSILYWIYFGGWLVPAWIRSLRARRGRAVSV